MDHKVKALLRKIAIGSRNRCDLITREERKDSEKCDDAGRMFDDNAKGLSFGKNQRGRCVARPSRGRTSFG